MPDYQVRTDVYNGPLDLLLFLIRRDEVDIYDIPVARVTGQYVEYVDALRVVDPNVAGDFLVMAATLMEIKSRMLLPRQEAVEGEEDDLSDPRMELVRQLLEYKAYKDASFALGDAAEAQAAKWPRNPVRVKPPAPGEMDIDDAQIWDLVAAFNKVMSSIGAGPATHDVVYDDTPIALHAVDIVDQLQEAGGTLSFEAIFEGRKKSEMIGLFLALLELIRQQRIRIVQATLFGEIRVQLLSAEPLEIGEEELSPLHEAVLGSPGSEAEPDQGQAESESRSDDAVLPTDESPPSIDDEEAETGEFDELDNIKTEIDIDSIIHADGPREPSAKQEPREP